MSSDEEASVDGLRSYAGPRSSLSPPLTYTLLAAAVQVEQRRRAIVYNYCPQHYFVSIQLPAAIRDPRQRPPSTSAVCLIRRHNAQHTRYEDLECTAPLVCTQLMLLCESSGRAHEHKTPQAELSK